MQLGLSILSFFLCLGLLGHPSTYARTPQSRSVNANRHQSTRPIRSQQNFYRSCHDSRFKTLSIARHRKTQNGQGNNAPLFPLNSNQPRPPFPRFESQKFTSPSGSFPNYLRGFAQALRCPKQSRKNRWFTRLLDPSKNKREQNPQSGADAAFHLLLNLDDPKLRRTWADAIDANLARQLSNKKRKTSEEQLFISKARRNENQTLRNFEKLVVQIQKALAKNALSKSNDLVRSFYPLDSLAARNNEALETLVGDVRAAYFRKLLGGSSLSEIRQRNRIPIANGLALPSDIELAYQRYNPKQPYITSAYDRWNRYQRAETPFDRASLIRIQSANDVTDYLKQALSQGKSHLMHTPMAFSSKMDPALLTQLRARLLAQRRAVQAGQPLDLGIKTPHLKPWERQLVLERALANAIQWIDSPPLRHGKHAIKLNAIPEEYGLSRWDYGDLLDLEQQMLTQRKEKEKTMGTNPHHDLKKISEFAAEHLNAHASGLEDLVKRYGHTDKQVRKFRSRAGLPTQSRLAIANLPLMYRQWILHQIKEANSQENAKRALGDIYNTSIDKLMTTARAQGAETQSNPLMAFIQDQILKPHGLTPPIALDKIAEVTPDDRDVLREWVLSNITDPKTQKLDLSKFKDPRLKEAYTAIVNELSEWGHLTSKTNDLTHQLNKGAFDLFPNTQVAGLRALAESGENGYLDLIRDGSLRYVPNLALARFHQSRKAYEAMVKRNPERAEQIRRIRHYFETDPQYKHAFPEESRLALLNLDDRESELIERLEVVARQYGAKANTRTDALLFNPNSQALAATAREYDWQMYAYLMRKSLTTPSSEDPMHTFTKLRRERMKQLEKPLLDRLKKGEDIAKAPELEELARLLATSELTQDVRAEIIDEKQKIDSIADKLKEDVPMPFLAPLCSKIPSLAACAIHAANGAISVPKPPNHSWIGRKNSEATLERIEKRHGADIRKRIEQRKPVLIQLLQHRAAKESVKAKLNASTGIRRNQWGDVLTALEEGTMKGLETEAALFEKAGENPVQALMLTTFGHWLKAHLTEKGHNLGSHYLDFEGDNYFKIKDLFDTPKEKKEREAELRRLEKETAQLDRKNTENISNALTETLTKLYTKTKGKKFGEFVEDEHDLQHFIDPQLKGALVNQLKAISLTLKGNARNTVRGSILQSIDKDFKKGIFPNLLNPFIQKKFLEAAQDGTKTAHRLSEAEARKKVQALFAQMQNQQSPFYSLGKKFGGNTTVIKVDRTMLASDQIDKIIVDGLDKADKTGADIHDEVEQLTKFIVNLESQRRRDWDYIERQRKELYRWERANHQKNARTVNTRLKNYAELYLNESLLPRIEHEGLKAQLSNKESGFRHLALEAIAGAVRQHYQQRVDLEDLAESGFIPTTSAAKKVQQYHDPLVRHFMAEAKKKFTEKDQLFQLPEEEANKLLEKVRHSAQTEGFQRNAEIRYANRILNKMGWTFTPSGAIPLTDWEEKRKGHIDALEPPADRNGYDRKITPSKLRWASAVLSEWNAMPKEAQKAYQKKWNALLSQDKEKLSDEDKQQLAVLNDLFAKLKRVRRIAQHPSASKVKMPDPIAEGTLRTLGLTDNSKLYLLNPNRVTREEAKKAMADLNTLKSNVKESIRASLTGARGAQLTPEERKELTEALNQKNPTEEQSRKILKHINAEVLKTRIQNIGGGEVFLPEEDEPSYAEIRKALSLLGRHSSSGDAFDAIENDVLNLYNTLGQTKHRMSVDHQTSARVEIDPITGKTKIHFERAKPLQEGMKHAFGRFLKGERLELYDALSDRGTWWNATQMHFTDKTPANRQWKEKEAAFLKRANLIRQGGFLRVPTEQGNDLPATQAYEMVDQFRKNLAQKEQMTLQEIESNQLFNLVDVGLLVSGAGAYRLLLRSTLNAARGVEHGGRIIRGLQKTRLGKYNWFKNALTNRTLRARKLLKSRAFKFLHRSGKQGVPFLKRALAMSGMTQGVHLAWENISQLRTVHDYLQRVDSEGHVLREGTKPEEKKYEELPPEFDEDADGKLDYIQRGGSKGGLFGFANPMSDGYRWKSIPMHQAGSQIETIGLSMFFTPMFKPLAAGVGLNRWIQTSAAAGLSNVGVQMYQRTKSSLFKPQLGNTLDELYGEEAGAVWARIGTGALRAAALANDLDVMATTALFPNAFRASLTQSKAAFWAEMKKLPLKQRAKVLAALAGAKTLQYGTGFSVNHTASQIDGHVEHYIPLKYNDLDNDGKADGYRTMSGREVRSEWDLLSAIASDSIGGDLMAARQAIKSVRVVEYSANLANGNIRIKDVGERIRKLNEDAAVEEEKQERHKTRRRKLAIKSLRAEAQQLQQTLDQAISELQYKDLDGKPQLQQDIIAYYQSKKYPTQKFKVPLDLDDRGKQFAKEVSRGKVSIKELDDDVSDLREFGLSLEEGANIQENLRALIAMEQASEKGFEDKKVREQYQNIVVAQMGDRHFQLGADTGTTQLRTLRKLIEKTITQPMDGAQKRRLEHALSSLKEGRTQIDEEALRTIGELMAEKATTPGGRPLKGVQKEAYAKAYQAYLQDAHFGKAPVETIRGWVERAVVRRNHHVQDALNRLRSLPMSETTRMEVAEVMAKHLTPDNDEAAQAKRALHLFTQLGDAKYQERKKMRQEESDRYVRLMRDELNQRRADRVNRLGRRGYFERNLQVGQLIPRIENKLARALVDRANSSTRERENALKAMVNARPPAPNDFEGNHDSVELKAVRQMNVSHPNSPRLSAKILEAYGVTDTPRVQQFTQFLIEHRDRIKRGKARDVSLDKLALRYLLKFGVPPDK